MMKTSAKLIGKLMNANQNWSQWIGLLGYGISLTLILAAYLVNYWSSAKTDGQATYLVVSKQINIANTLGFGQSNLTPSDLQSLKQQPYVEAFAPMTSSNFQAFASVSLNGQKIGTALFFEALPISYLDVQPEAFTWTEGETTIPIILGRDFLNLYNFGFALSQGLPQVSADAVQLLSFDIEINNGEFRYKGRIVGFSDRINSILVPESFMGWANRNGVSKTSRALVRLKTKTNSDVIGGLANLGLTANQEILRLSTISKTLQQTSQVVSILALLFIGLAISQLVLGQQLYFASKAAEINILSDLGYQPNAVILPTMRPLVIKIGLITILVLGLIFACKHVAQTQFRFPNPPAQNLIATALILYLVVIGINYIALLQRFLNKN
jgi:hypothetical protein